LFQTRHFLAVLFAVTSLAPSAWAQVMDVDPPLLVSAEGLLGPPSTILLMYSEPVDIVTAIDPFNYIVQKLPAGDLLTVVSGTEGADESKVILEISELLLPDMDYRVTALDIADLAGNFSQEQSLDFQPVPEPTTCALGLLGLVGLFWMRYVCRSTFHAAPKRQV
jgi:hypothetical protein